MDGSFPFNHTIETITKYNGLSSNIVNDVVIVGDQIYVATHLGINVFSTSFNPKKIDPILHITKFSINDTERSINDRISVPYRENNIRIVFQGLHFPSGSNLIYKYRLIGADEEWITTTSRALNFFNLNPGDYTFELKVYSRDEVTVSETKSIRFTINPPFWETWWFLTLLIFSGVILAYFIFQSRLKVIRKRLAIRYEIYKLENRVIRAQLNPHFFFNALNSIQNYVAKNEPDDAVRYLSKFSKLIRGVLESSNAEMVSLEKELEFLGLYVEIERLRFKDKLNYKLNVQKGMDLSEIEIPVFILQPYVENSIWHGLQHKKEGGTVTINICSVEKDIIIEIIDDGVGRAFMSNLKRMKEHNSMGMKITERRLEMLKKLYKMEIAVSVNDGIDSDGNNCGTIVRLKIENK